MENKYTEESLFYSNIYREYIKLAEYECPYSLGNECIHAEDCTNEECWLR